MIHLILGGARSGKSRRALELARKTGSRRVVFLATAERIDAEMRARVAAHRRERPSGWTTIEESRRVPERLLALPAGSTVILDCLTLWIARLMSDRGRPAFIPARIDGLVAAVRRRRLRVIVVSNEVGSGVVPPTRLGRVFQDALGAANTRLASAATRVELMVAGLPLRLKG